MLKTPDGQRPHHRISIEFTADALIQAVTQDESDKLPLKAVVDRLKRALIKAGAKRGYPNLEQISWDLPDEIIIQEPFSYNVHQRSGEGPYTEGLFILTPLQSGIFVPLFSQAGRTFTPKQLITSAWGNPDLADVSTLKNHISKIRTKIDPFGQGPNHLEAVTSIGYRFVVCP